MNAYELIKKMHHSKENGGLETSLKSGRDVGKFTQPVQGERCPLSHSHSTRGGS